MIWGCNIADMIGHKDLFILNIALADMDSLGVKRHGKMIDSDYMCFDVSPERAEGLDFIFEHGNVRTHSWKRW